MKGIWSRGPGLECIIAFFCVRDGVLDYADAAHRISFREENKDVSAWFRFLETHVKHELFELALPLGVLELELACARNPFETHQIPNLNFNPSRTTASLYRNGLGPGLDVMAIVAVLGFCSLLGGLVFWGFHILFVEFERCSVGEKDRKVFRVRPRRKGCSVRIFCGDHWVRVPSYKQFVLHRKAPKPQTRTRCMLSMLFCKACSVLGSVCAWLGVLDLVEEGNDESPPASSPLVCHLRMMHRGLPVPGQGTKAEPFDLEAPRGGEPGSSSSRVPEGVPSPSSPDYEPSEVSERPPKPPENPPEPPDSGEEGSFRIPLSSTALYHHRAQGHFPYDSNCDSCCSSKGRVPARRLRRHLQKENQTVGLDFFFFGKLRVLLMTHLGSRYTVSLPAPNLEDPQLLANINRVLREMGLVGKAVTFRMDQEGSIIALAERLSRSRNCPHSATIVDVVPGYRPQAKGSIERQVESVRQGFWAVWLDLERQIALKKFPGQDAELGKYQLPLGGLLWQACVFYVSRCYNLWSSGHGDSTTSIDLLHEEIVHRTRTLPFGCVVQAKVSKSKAHLAKYRGAKTVKAVYLGPVNARGGGIFAAPFGSTEIDVFPTGRIVDGACEVGTVEGLAVAQSLVLDGKDPERPVLYEPEGVDDGNGPEDEVMEGGVGPLNEEDEEMIADDTYAPVSAPAEEGEAGILPDEGENMEDMEIDWLTNHLLESLYRGPDLRATSQEVADSFTLKFGGSRVKCQVPRNAVSETSGEQLDPSLLYASMKLELEELESFGVGKVISEDEARKSARESGRRVLTSRWVNTVKRKGLYRSRLVVRDYASMGGTTLSEGIYSPTTSLEGLRLLLALLCRRGSVLSCDVSVAFMHAAVSRPEYVELPSNVSIADSKIPQKAGNKKVYLRLHKAMNGLRSAPLSWYKELSSHLEQSGFSPSLDPTIYRRKTSKGLTLVLFYVDDLLIYSEDPSEGKKVFEDLQKRYKLKLTGELHENCAGEVSFLGRRIFRNKGEKRVYFGLDAKYLDSCCEEYGITKPNPKLPSLEKRYSDLIKKGQTEKISPAAHEKYRRTLGRLAWAALSRPDLQFCCGFLGRHQSAPDEAAETCMRDVLKWVKGLPHKVQVFPSTREILEDDADPQAVSCFTDASWSLNSVSGGVITWKNCCLKTFSRKQSTTALSSAESELAALTEIAREGLYIALLTETILEGIPKDRETGYYLLKGYSDSESAVSISKMGTLLRKVRHIELRAAFLQELVQFGRFTIEPIPGAVNPADVASFRNQSPGKRKIPEPAFLSRLKSPINQQMKSAN